jgi:hypothetical protein
LITKKELDHLKEIKFFEIGGLIYAVWNNNFRTLISY